MRRRDKIRFWLQDTHELIYQFRMRFDMWLGENVLGQCGTCRRKNGSGHKMDCNREWEKQGD